MTPAGLPHSDTPGSQLGCQLPRAYRRLQRPSSALDAKASTMCPSQLVSQTLNKNHKDTQPHHPPIKEQQGHYKNNQTTTTHTPTRGHTRSLPDARVHYPLTKHHAHPPPPRTRRGQQQEAQTNHPTTSDTPHKGDATSSGGPDSSGPNSVPKPTPTGHPPGSTPPTRPPTTGQPADGRTEENDPPEAGVHR